MKRKLERVLAKILLMVSGWRLEGEVPDLKKCIIIGAPHTSNWDFFFGMLYKLYYGLNIHFLMKEELFRFPLKSFFKLMRGIPVNRHKKNNLVEVLQKKFTQEESFYLALAPEGTRGKTKVWKRGFYYIATKAKVPIVLGYMDYSRKTVGVGPVFYPGGDIEADMAEIKNYYSNVKAKFPDRFHAQSGSVSVKSHIHG